MSRITELTREFNELREQWRQGQLGDEAYITRSTEILVEAKADIDGIDIPSTTTLEVKVE